MATADELGPFIASSFRSVWALELLLLLRQEGRACSIEELVSKMRASRAVVENGLESLVAAGLALAEKDGGRYRPINAQVAALVEQTEQLYQTRPDRVRRLIVTSTHKSLSAFSDAFRLKD